MADAAILCPSFYQADVVKHPTPIERWLTRLRRAVIGRLQARREARRLVFADG